MAEIPISVLLIEDAPTIRTLVKTVIDFGGEFQTEAHDNPISAIKAFEDCPEKYPLVFTDRNFSDEYKDLKGEVLAQRFREIAGKKIPGKPPRIVMFTADELQEADKRRIINCGVNTIIKKPFPLRLIKAEMVEIKHQMSADQK